MSSSKLYALDLQHVWHPCSQMKDYEKFKPLIIDKASGSYLELKDGKKVIDAISSWWCKSLGHNHPELKKALLRQLDKFEHVILANTTNEIIVELSSLLAGIIPGMEKAFYASDGACAVEIAMKMSLHSRVITGDEKRTQFIALKNSYHGETAGALSVSDLGSYRAPYLPMLFDVYFIESVPYVLNLRDPLWHDCSEIWDQVVKQLEPYIDTATAIIVESIVQGAAGMRIYSQDFLKKLSRWANENNVHLIADEIMTGIGRTGKMLACEHADIRPDFICLSKGLTSGWLPLSVVLTNNEIYAHFYADENEGKAFLHSHTFSGNPLAACIATETLKIVHRDKLCEKAQMLEVKMLNDMQEIANNTGRLKNVRSIGAVVAADLITDEKVGRVGQAVYKEAIKLGALLRPIGDTIYWLPPLNIEDKVLESLKRITQEAITEVNLSS